MIGTAAQFARAAGITARTLRNKEKEIILKMTTPIHFLVFIAGPVPGSPDGRTPPVSNGSLPLLSGTASPSSTLLIHNSSRSWKN